jgi:hypothetical protein
MPSIIITRQYAAKITMDMHNWPWVAKEWANGTSNPSYLKFFLLGNGASPEILENTSLSID